MSKEKKLVPQVDYNWQKIITILVDRFGVDCVAMTGELGLNYVNHIRTGIVREPTYSSGILLMQVFQHFFSSRLDEVSL